MLTGVCWSMAEEKKADKNADSMNKNKFDVVPDWKSDDCVYTGCYCEENVWHLCDKTRKEGRNLDDHFVIFLSNKNKQFPIWCAKTAKSNDDALIWDYHVIYLWINRKNPNKSLIFDLDSTLTFPTEINQYMKSHFGRIRF